MTDEAKKVFVDQTLLRALINRDVRPLFRMDRTIPVSFTDPLHPIHKTLKPVLGRFATGRLPDLSFFQNFALDFDRYVTGESVVFDVVGSSDLTTYPNETPRRYAYLVRVPGQHILTGRCSSYWTIEGFSGVQDTNLFEITVHTLERFYQRTSLPVSDFSASVISRNILSRYGFLLFFVKDGLFFEKFALPYADGLLLGVRSDTPIANYCRVHQSRTGRKFGGYSGFGTDEFTALPRIMTFVGPNELSLRQKSFIQLFSEFEDRYRAPVQAFAQFCYSFGETIFEADALSGFNEAWDNFCVLSLDQEMLKATGNWDVARELQEIERELDDMFYHDED